MIYGEGECFLEMVVSVPCPKCGMKILEEIPTDFGSFYCCMQCGKELTDRVKS